MTTGFSHLHSLLRWILLLLLVITIIKAFTSKNYSAGDKKLALFTMIAAHVQLLLGFSLYFMKGIYKFFQMEGAMSNSFQRFWMIEHLFGMLVAIILITVGYSKVKKASDEAGKNKSIKVFYTIALIIILLTIPWPFKEGFAAYGWF
ncbi:MAG: cytochrome B [Flavobacteriales bacterium]|nr:cytochrome B [Flavobacteriales bacterium]